MMKKYVFENDWDVSLFDSLEEAKQHYDFYFSNLTEQEKKKIAYFRLYSIEFPTMKVVENTSDLLDLKTEDIAIYK